MSRPAITAYINGNARGFHDAMRRVRGDATTTGRHTRASFEATANYLRGGASRLAASISAGPMGLASALGLGVFVAQATESVRVVRELGQQARQAGVEFEAFQELKFAAEKNTVSVGALTSGLYEMNKRMVEFARDGGGRAQDAMAAIGMTAEEVALKLQEPDKLFEEIIERVKGLDAASQINVMDRIFGGTAAREFVDFLDQTGWKISDARDKAREFNGVMSNDTLRLADEVNEAFTDIGRTIQNWVHERWVRFSGDVLGLMERLYEVENRRASTLTNEIRALDSERLANENKILALRAEQEELWHSTAEVERRYIDGTIKALEEQNEKLLEAITRREQILANSPPGAGGTRQVVEPTDPPATGGRSRQTSEIERQRQAVRELITSLEHELSLIGMSNLEQAKANALRQAGAAATPEQRQEIERLIETIHRENDALAENQQRMEERARALDHLFSTAGDALMSITDKSANAEEAVKRLAVQLAFAAAQALLLGTGPLAGLFGGGSLFGGGGGLNFPGPWGGPRAAGGDVSPGRIYQVNEKGIELFQPSSHGRIHPAGAGGGQAGRLGIDIFVNDDGRLVAIAREEGHRAGAQAADVRVQNFSSHELPERVQAINRSPRRRG